MQLDCGTKRLDLSTAQIMGILNVTPDSFSDGGRYSTLDAALKQAERMLLEGASIIDIGGESTRPGANPVTTSEELARVIPLVDAIASRLDVLISVDTSTPEVMTAAAQAGAHLINDVRSLSRPNALAAAAATGLPICLMHMNGEPGVMQHNPVYDLPIEDAVYQQLHASIARCLEAGIARERLLIDPGFGFGKTTAHDYRLLNRLERLQALQLPMLTGLSRKRMIGAATGQATAAERIIGSVSGAVICALKGARILRVHDVKETAQALQVVTSMVREGNV